MGLGTEPNEAPLPGVHWRAEGYAETKARTREETKTEKRNRRPILTRVYLLAFMNRDTGAVDRVATCGFDNPTTVGEFSFVLTWSSGESYSDARVKIRSSVNPRAWGAHLEPLVREELGL